MFKFEINKTWLGYLVDIYPPAYTTGEPIKIYFAFTKRGAIKKATKFVDVFTAPSKHEVIWYEPQA